MCPSRAGAGGPELPPLCGAQIRVERMMWETQTTSTTGSGPLRLALGTRQGSTGLKRGRSPGFKGEGRIKGEQDPEFKGEGKGRRPNYLKGREGHF